MEAVVFTRKLCNSKRLWCVLRLTGVAVDAPSRLTGEISMKYQMTRRTIMAMKTNRDVHSIRNRAGK